MSFRRGLLSQDFEVSTTSVSSPAASRFLDSDEDVSISDSFLLQRGRHLLRDVHSRLNSRAIQEAADKSVSSLNENEVDDDSLLISESSLSEAQRHTYVLDENVPHRTGVDRRSPNLIDERNKEEECGDENSSQGSVNEEYIDRCCTSQIPKEWTRDWNTLKLQVFATLNSLPPRVSFAQALSLVDRRSFLSQWCTSGSLHSYTRTYRPPSTTCSSPSDVSGEEVGRTSAEDLKAENTEEKREQKCTDSVVCSCASYGSYTVEVGWNSERNYVEYPIELDSNLPAEKPNLQREIRLSLLLHILQSMQMKSVFGRWKAYTTYRKSDECRELLGQFLERWKEYINRKKWKLELKRAANILQLQNERKAESRIKKRFLRGWKEYRMRRQIKSSLRRNAIYLYNSILCDKFFKLWKEKFAFMQKVNNNVAIMLAFDVENMEMANMHRMKAVFRSWYAYSSERRLRTLKMQTAIVTDRKRVEGSVFARWLYHTLIGQRRDLILSHYFDRITTDAFYWWKTRLLTRKLARREVGRARAHHNQWLLRVVLRRLLKYRRVCMTKRLLQDKTRLRKLRMLFVLWRLKRHYGEEKRTASEFRWAHHNSRLVEGCFAQWRAKHIFHQERRRQSEILAKYYRNHHRISLMRVHLRSWLRYTRSRVQTKEVAKFIERKREISWWNKWCAHQLSRKKRVWTRKFVGVVGKAMERLRMQSIFSAWREMSMAEREREEDLVYEFSRQCLLEKYLHRYVKVYRQHRIRHNLEKLARVLYERSCLRNFLCVWRIKQRWMVQKREDRATEWRHVSLQRKVLREWSDTAAKRIDTREAFKETLQMYVVMRRWRLWTNTAHTGKALKNVRSRRLLRDIFEHWRSRVNTERNSRQVERCKRLIHKYWKRGFLSNYHKWRSESLKHFWGKWTEFVWDRKVRHQTRSFNRSLRDVYGASDESFGHSRESAPRIVVDSATHTAAPLLDNHGLEDSLVVSDDDSSLRDEAEMQWERTLQMSRKYSYDDTPEFEFLADSITY